MRQVVAILFLLSWVPFVFALAFPEVEDGLYMITGIMWALFGTWGSILLLKDRN